MCGSAAAAAGVAAAVLLYHIPSDLVIQENKVTHIQYTYIEWLGFSLTAHIYTFTYNVSKRNKIYES